MEDLNRLDHQLLAGTAEIRNFIGSKVISDAKGEIDRVTRYALFWKFYEGDHFRQGNDGILSFNYVRAFIDKVPLFLMGKTGCTWHVKSLYNAVVDKKVETAAEEFLNYHWNKNKKLVLLYEMFQMGGITGDLWCSLNWQDLGAYCKIQVLNSGQCFPVFTNGDFNRLEAFTVRQGLAKNPNNYTTFVQSFTLDSIATWYQKDAKSDGSSYKYEPTTVKNPYGFIPIVHIKNKAKSNGYYSTSDANDILKLNKVYNELNQDLKTIIDYYSSPTTVITGASAKSLRRGEGNIWSGLPSDANVFNLGLDVDLGAMSNFTQTLKTAMHELSDVPENALGKLQAISNTSAAALQLTYQPLIQQADMKGLTYGEGMVELNELMMRMTRYHRPLDPRLAILGDDFIDSNRVEPIWSYGFPQDRMGELQQLIIEFQLKLASRSEAMNRLGKENVPDLILEIHEDAIRNATETAEIMSITGVPPDATTADQNSEQAPPPAGA